MMRQTNFSRRTFLKGSALAAGGVALNGCTSTRSAARFRKPGELLNLGVVGTGGQGRHDWTSLVNCGGVRIAALSDVDATFLDDAKKWHIEKG